MKSLIIDTEKLKENITAITQYAKGATVFAVLKCNGYGLGLLEFAKILTENGVNHFAVSDVHEGVTLRQHGFKEPILLLSATCIPSEVELIAEHDIIATIADEKSTQLLNEAGQKLGRKLPAHINIETGFGRFGFNSAAEVNQALPSADFVEVQGIFSHLSDAFGAKENTTRQWNRFQKTVAELEQSGLTFAHKHIANSSAFLRYPELHLNTVRVGSAFLGRLSIPSPIKLNRIAYLQSRVSYVKSLPKGSNIGYANTCTLKRDSKIAVIGVGYSDGFGVAKKNDAFRPFDIARYLFHDMKCFLSDNRIFVTIKGKRCPLLGRVSMYNVIADITGTDIAPGDVVTLDCNPILIDSSIERIYQ